MSDGPSASPSSASPAARREALVEALAGDLAPVRPLAPPSQPSARRLGAVALLALAMSPFADMETLARRMATPDLRYAAAGAGLTAIAAALAAFQVSVPGRSRRWALLPAAPALLWIGASGLGCLRGWLAPGSGAAEGETAHCFAFLMSVSLPLSALLVLMLRRACPLQPGLAAGLGGLAAAAAAALLLVPFHPHDATLTDLASHAVAVALILALNGFFGGRILSRSGIPDLGQSPTRR